MSEIVSSFLAAADAFCELAKQELVATRWADQSALEGYSVGGLVGHVTAGISWVERLLETTPPSDAPVMSLGDYCAPFPVRKPEDLDTQLHTWAREQGERGAQRGPAETVAKLRARVERLPVLLAKEDVHRLIDLRPTVPGAIRLDNFIRTRILEVVIHGDDLAVSVGMTSFHPDAGAAALAIGTLITAARENHGDLEVIRALSRGERSAPNVVPVL